MENNKVSFLRYRGSKLDKVKELDAFPKIPEKFVQTSPVGGTLSVFSFAIIFWLIYSEIQYYMDSKFIFKFSPDTDFDEKLKINVDITVAMPCGTLGADILDSTNQNAYKFGTLEEEDTWFDLSPNQRKYFDSMRYINSYLREEFHAIQELLWKSSQISYYEEMPKRNDKPDRPYDACRIYGTLILNKVAGNFHITAGKSLALPRGHIHISAFMTERDYNFTHRINRLNFGDPSPGVIHPLDGDEKISNDNMMLFQYFIEVVPTKVKTFLTTTNTYQYSVKELGRTIDHHKGSHGMPGIFFKYDMSALKVTVRQERDNFLTFLARLCATVGGIYVCSGLVNNLIQLLADVVFCRWTMKLYEKGNIHSNLVEIKPVPVSIMTNPIPESPIKLVQQ